MRFNQIYSFTTENIRGYMEGLDLSGKRVITITGSSDHILNIILQGCLDILTFDINILSKYYMELKLAAIKTLSYDEFLNFLLYDTKDSFSYDIIQRLNFESKSFWLNELRKNGNDGLKMKHSFLFNLKYYQEENKISNNLYLTRESYQIVKERLDKVKIQFVLSDVKDFEVDGNYDYMFLSNVSDYLKDIYGDKTLENYKKLIDKFSSKVKVIYLAYIYDIDSSNKRSRIDDIEEVKRIFGKTKIKKFKTALIGQNTNDAVIIMEV